MSKKQYNNYSKMANKPTTKNDVAEVSSLDAAVKEEAVETCEPVENVEVVETVEAIKVTYGTVVNCDKLNVRSKPKTDSDVVLVIAKGDKVVIEEDASTDNFFKVCSLPGNEGFNGYCMKQYIDIEK